MTKKGLRWLLINILDNFKVLKLGECARQVVLAHGGGGSTVSIPKPIQQILNNYVEEIIKTGVELSN